MARAAGVRSFAFFYVPTEELALRRVLVQREYTEFGPNHRVAVLRVCGQTFDDYLSGFGKRRRDSIRWERRKIAAAGVRIGCEELTSDLSRQMPPPEAQPYAKQGHHAYPEEMARILHESVIKKYGNSAPVITARAAEVLRGYAAFIQVNKALYSRDTG
jgi:predicted N-acyltransferase